MGEIRIALTILVGTPEGRDHSDDLGVDGRIILKLILGKLDGTVQTGLIWLRTGIDGEIFWRQ
jgi:hypothetical protein